MADNPGEVTAAILAGGLGMRLRSVVGDRPKVLAEVCGRPFLTFLLDQLAGALFREVVLLTGYGAEQVRNTLGEHYAGMRLIYSTEPSPLDTAGALRWALPKLNFSTVLLLNGDSFCGVDLHTFRLFHFQRDADVSLVLAHVSDTVCFGRVEWSEHDEVRHFEEKGKTGGAGWVNAGIYLLERRLIEDIPSRRSASLERDLFPAWVRRMVVSCFRFSGQFFDIGTPQAYAEAERFFQRRPVETAHELDRQ